MRTVLWPALLCFMISLPVCAGADTPPSPQGGASPSPQASASPATGVAYDEIRWRAIDTAPLPPGSFSADREQLMRHATPAERYPDVDGNVLGNLGAGSMTTQPQFVALYRYSYYGDWVRVDDLLAQTAAISRPDLGQTIFLNLAMKVYHTVQSPSQPAPMPSPSASPGPSAPPEPDNYRFEISASQGPGMALDGMHATELILDGKLTTVRATPGCIQIQGSMHWVLYQDPDIFNPPATPVNLTAPLAIFKCRFDMQKAGLDQPQTNLVLYMSVTLNMSTDLIKVKPIVTVIERGNVAKLGPADAALFNIPKDFLPQGSVSSVLWSRS